MLAIHKKLIVDERGKPTDVIIPWMEFLEISELLGLDLDETTEQELKEAEADRVAGNEAAYVNLEGI